MKYFAVTCIAFILINISPYRVYSQNITKDPSINVGIIYAFYGYGVPSMDLADRFKNSNQVGAGYLYKFKNNWNMSIEGNFIFRDAIKDPYSIISGISTHDGSIIGESGTMSNVMLLQRAYTGFAKVGKLFPIMGPNNNSGLMIQAGAGFLQHKIRIDVSSNNVPQLSDNYKKGYDHLCNGVAFVEYVGYQHLSNNRKLNFYGGIEVIQGFTQSRRAYYFNEMIRPSEKRIDILSSVKVGWLIPLYKKQLERFYYN